jgi:hypothetical protein
MSSYRRNDGPVPKKPESFANVPTHVAPPLTSATDDSKARNGSRVSNSSRVRSYSEATNGFKTPNGLEKPNSSEASNGSNASNGPGLPDSSKAPDHPSVSNKQITISAAGTLHHTLVSTLTTRSRYFAALFSDPGPRSTPRSRSSSTRRRTSSPATSCPTSATASSP